MPISEQESQSGVSTSQAAGTCTKASTSQASHSVTSSPCGESMLHVEACEHELVFTPPVRLAHCIAVLERIPVRTSRQLSLSEDEC